MSSGETSDYPPPPRGWRLIGTSHAIPWRKHKRLMRKNRIKLNEAESRSFLDALRTPPHPNDALRRLMAKLAVWEQKA